MHSHSRLQRWVSVMVPNMKKFISLVINMGLNHENKIEIYWTKSKSQIIPLFTNVTLLKHFENIKSMFHIRSKQYIPPKQLGHDPWYKVRPFLDSINKSFKTYFIPHQNVSIDESMIGMKNSFVRNIM